MLPYVSHVTNRSFHTLGLIISCQKTSTTLSVEVVSTGFRAPKAYAQVPALRFYARRGFKDPRAHAQGAGPWLLGLVSSYTLWHVSRLVPGVWCVCSFLVLSSVYFPPPCCLILLIKFLTIVGIIYLDNIIIYLN